ncbi:hypothetical protein AB0P15_36635 [Streptomyces sp. NPDC087917]|uniref:hypothetical protein n=1 Tax=Streptomyces sp. NPDC087917 TaxID=3155060 RepID=UPI00342D7E93
MGIGIVSDEAGAIASRGSFYAWSASHGPAGFHATQDQAVARVVRAWLNVGTEPAALMTGPGTVHASRPTADGGRGPACMADRAAAGLKVMLRTGRQVTCRHCPQH